MEDNRAWKKDRVIERSNELASFNGVILTPSDFHSTLIRDYDSEFNKTKDEVRKIYDKFIPLITDFVNPDDYNDELTRFQAKRYALIVKENDNRTRMLDFMRYFKPLTPVTFDGYYGYFVGYKIKDTKTKFKYTDGSIDFTFCFLNRYPVLHLKVSSDSQTLSSIKTQSTLLFGSPLGNDYKKRIEDWKPNYNQRTVRRFLSGNILSGILEANSKQSRDEITNWSLVRFTNDDGSYSTAVEMKFDRPLPLTTVINPNKVQLSVSCDNQNFLDYLEKLPVSTSSQVVPLWNIPCDKVYERMLCIVKQYDGNIKGDSTIEIQFPQQFVDDKKNGKIKQITDEKHSRYSVLFHDVALLNKYQKYLLTKVMRPQKIKYGLMVWEEKDKYGKAYQKTKYNEMSVYIKTLVFNLDTQKSELKGLFKDLANKYDAAFNFRASDEEMLGTGFDDKGNPIELPDTFDPTVDNSKKELYSEGEYQYRFTEPVKDSFVSSIPNFISSTPEGIYGGVILSLPIPPSNVPSYKLKPYKLPNDVLVKLTISQFRDKEIFGKLLEEQADKSPLEVGQFVQKFISERSVSPLYFFGDMRTPDFGLIFKEYALNNDLSNLVFDEPEIKKTRRQPKTKVEFDDAENFLIELIKS